MLSNIIRRGLNPSLRLRHIVTMPHYYGAGVNMTPSSRLPGSSRNAGLIFGYFSAIGLVTIASAKHAKKNQRNSGAKPDMMSEEMTWIISY